MLKRFTTAWVHIAVIVSIGLLAGCAANYSPKICEQLDPEFYEETRDPMESLNRSFFKFNVAVDNAVTKPVARGYRKHVPKVVQTGISNFGNFANEPRNLVSTLMQGKADESARVLLRVALNGTLGVFGLVDIAGAVGLPYKDHDIGMAFAYWGIGDGMYTVFPFLGPSNTRDTAGFLFHGKFTYAIKHIEDSDLRTTVQLTNIINARAELLPVTDIIEKQPDPYLFTRESYRQNRIQRICE